MTGDGISLCMIVRDEQELLGACLASVADLCEHIVVVDTGSTDGTMAIAREYGADVIESPWCGDFSAARNVSLEHARCRWILQLDADERLHRDDRLQLQHRIRTGDAEVYLLKILNDLPSGGVGSFFAPRLFRNRPEHRFEGIVHNQLRHRSPAVATEIRIRHLGYALPPEQLRRKAERSIPLLERQIERTPQAAFPRYNLAVFCHTQRDYARGREQALAAADRFGKAERLQRIAALDLAALCAQQLGNSAAAIADLERALVEQSDYIDARFDLADVYASVGRFGDAIREYHAYFAARKRWQRECTSTGIMLRTLESPGIAWNNLAAAYRNQGYDDLSRACYAFAVRECPGLGVVRLNYANLLGSRGQLAEAVEHFEAALELLGPRPEVVEITAATHAQLGRLDRAHALLSEVVKAAPNRVSAIDLLGTVCHQRGDLEGARALWTRILELQPGAETIRARLDALSDAPSAVVAKSSARASS